MNKKQIIGLIAAALVFVFVGVSSAVTHSIFNTSKDTSSVKDAISSVANSDSVELPHDDFIGVVKVEGTIMDSSESGGLFSSNTQAYNHKKTLQYVEDMMNSSSNKGILLYVNSPGGGVYEADELYLKLKEYKEKTKRPIWTYMASEACSGGYYISMASDKIYANRNAWTGSIGVIVSLTNMKGLYDKLGIKEVDITSGPNKAMGSSGQDLTDEQRDILQKMVDEAYDQFAGIVAEGRNMDINKVKQIGDGRVYTAKQALNLGLIDKIDTYQNMQDEMLKKVGKDVEIYEPVQEENVLSSLFSKAQSLKTKSDAQIISEYLEKQNNGGLMYYAKQQ